MTGVLKEEVEGDLTWTHRGEGALKKDIGVLSQARDGQEPLKNGQARKNFL